jgi:WS/DGAT/MGAT family acyltransferase
MKLHHAVSDGVGLVRMTKSMVEREREVKTRSRAAKLSDLPDAEARSATELLRDALAHRVDVTTTRLGRVVNGTVRWLGAMASDPLGTARGAREMAESIGRMLRPITEPLSPVMRERGMALALDAFTVPLEDVKRAALAAGGSVNDVFVAAVAGGMRLYHEHHGKPVLELQMMMPINLRGDGEKSATAGNQFAPSRFLVPVGTVDPRERVALIQERVRAQRREPALAYLDDVTGVLNRLPRAAMASVMGAMVTSIDFVTSNVPGPRRPVYTAGAKIEHMFPFGPPAGAAVNITLFSYDGICHVGVNADRAAVPDPRLLVECLKKGLDEMLALE